MRTSLLRRTSVTLTFVLTFTTLVVAPFMRILPAAAVSASEWRAGRIMDDSIMRNSNSMSVQAIQNFLNSKVPNCDTWGSKNSEYGGGTRAQYGASQGSPAPYICLKNYSENGKSAAQIIWEKGQQYRINPQVLLVTLQKEQNLVTDEWPWPVQYQKAAGYGCPDTAPCNAYYYGFSNQLSWSARLLQGVLDRDPTWYSVYNTGYQFIRYSPIQSCGGSTIVVESLATAALYNFTPYQPNQAALNNLYGTGDSCSAHGNRNFWRLFNDWFGTTRATFSDVDYGENRARVQTIEYNGQIYAFYFDAFQNALRMATQNNSNGQWEFTTLDGMGGTGGRVLSDVGAGIATIVYQNKLHVFYYYQTGGNLRQAWFNGSTWNFWNLDGNVGSIGNYDGDVGINPSVTVFNNELELVYYDKGQGNLRHGFTSGGNWFKFENMDGNPGSIANYNGDVGNTSVITKMGGSLQLFYYDRGQGNLRHGRTDNTGWHFENLDGNVGSIANSVSDLGLNPVAMMYGDTLQLFYYDRGHGNLRHAYANNTGWHFENLDGNRGSMANYDSDVGANISMTILNDALHVFYYDKSQGNLRHGWSDNLGWHFNNQDGNVGSIGNNNTDTGVNSAVTAYGSSLQLWYYDRSTGHLRHGRTDGNTWYSETLGPTIIY